MHKGFADLSLTTWVRRRQICSPGILRDLGRSLKGTGSELAFDFSGRGKSSDSDSCQLPFTNNYTPSILNEKGLCKKSSPFTPHGLFGGIWRQGDGPRADKSRSC